jgi:DNA-binding MarR family transcriptional regulator
MNNNIDTQHSRLSSNTEKSAEKLVELQQHQIAEVLTFAAALARKMGLSVSEMAALEHLHASRGGLTPTQLGKRLSMSSGTVSPLVDRLERAGYVERHPNPEDRRSSVVKMTTWGVEESSRHLLPLAADFLEIASGLGQKERSSMGSYLEAVSDALSCHARKP